MDEHGNGFSERLEKLVGETVEVLLKNEKTIVGKLICVGKQMNIAISSGDDVFFIHGDAVAAIKKGELRFE